MLNANHPKTSSDTQHGFPLTWGGRFAAKKRPTNFRMVKVKDSHPADRGIAEKVISSTQGPARFPWIFFRRRDLITGSKMLFLMILLYILD